MSNVRIYKRDPGHTVTADLPEGGAVIAHFPTRARADAFVAAMEAATQGERTSCVQGALGGLPADCEPVEDGRERLR